MEVKGLQGGGATGTPVAAKLHVAFLQGARLDVELEVFWVLDTAKVFLLLLPYLLDPFVVQQRNAQSVLPTRAVKQRLISDPISLLVSSTPVVLLLQCSANSLRVM